MESDLANTNVRNYAGIDKPGKNVKDHTRPEDKALFMPDTQYAMIVICVNSYQYLNYIALFDYFICIKLHYNIFEVIN